MAKSKPLFEHKTCGRCGGSGHYSYNQINGTTCFGCGGSGTQLTKRGLAAQRWFRDQTTVKVEDLKVGERALVDGFGFVARATVSRIDPPGEDGAGGCVWFTWKGRMGNVKEEGWGFGCTARRLPVDAWDASWQKAVGLAYQERLTKAGTVKKGA